MFGKKKQSEEQKLICPHCEKEVERVEWRSFGEEAGKPIAWLIGCGGCKKVIGANHTQTLV